MTIKTKTTTVESVEVQVRLDEILAEVFAKNPELKDGFTRTNSTLVGGPSDRVLLVSFGRRTETEKELKAEVPADELSQQRTIVRAALGTASTFYTGATPEDQAKVEEIIITAWKESGTGDALSDFALPYYRTNLRDRYNTTTERFEFSFAPWQPSAEQVTEASDILGIRIPFGQLSEDGKSKAVLEVLRKWHENGETLSLRSSGLYENFFKGSELYLSTEFGKQNQGRT